MRVIGCDRERGRLSGAEDGIVEKGRVRTSAVDGCGRIVDFESPETAQFPKQRFRNQRPSGMVQRDEKAEMVGIGNGVIDGLGVGGSSVHDSIVEGLAAPVLRGSPAPFRAKIDMRTEIRMFGEKIQMNDGRLRRIDAKNIVEAEFVADECRENAGFREVVLCPDDFMFGEGNDRDSLRQIECFQFFRRASSIRTRGVRMEICPKCRKMMRKNIHDYVCREGSAKYGCPRKRKAEIRKGNEWRLFY